MGQWDTFRDSEVSHLSQAFVFTIICMGQNNTKNAHEVSQKSFNKNNILRFSGENLGQQVSHCPTLGHFWDTFAQSVDFNGKILGHFWDSSGTRHHLFRCPHGPLGPAGGSGTGGTALKIGALI